MKQLPKKKFYAFKKGKVLARQGNPGEEVKTVLKTIIDSKANIVMLADESRVEKGDYFFKIENIYSKDPL